MNNAKSTQKDRSIRVIAIRKNLKLTRGEFAKTLGIAKGTLQHWENSEDKSGLTERGAERLQKALKNYGVDVAIAWLLHGIGDRPHFSDSLLTAEQTKIDLKISPREQKFINDELALFHEHYKHAISMTVCDNKMQPLFFKGDVIAGVKLFDDNIKAALNKVCIIMTAQGDLLLRIVKESNIPLQYELTQLNYHENSMISELKFAAPISLIRKIISY